MLVGFFSYFQINSSNLYYMNPVFYCEGSDQRVTEVEACPKIQFCSIGTNFLY
jgi:hypothetical protein